MYSFAALPRSRIPVPLRKKKGLQLAEYRDTSRRSASAQLPELDIDDMALECDDLFDEFDDLHSPVKGGFCLSHVMPWLHVK